MRGKIIGLVAVLFLLLFGILAENYFIDGKKHRYHQHLENQSQQVTCEDSSPFCTHLPLVVVDTLGKEIPGKPIYDENGHRVAYSLTDTGEEMLEAKFALIDQNEVNHLNDQPSLETQTLIRVRGRSSREFEKSSYLLRFIEEDKTYRREKVNGMDKHYEWALYGPYMDKTLIRNYMWYNIAGEIMNYSPNIRFCEVVINGEYQGVYLLSETITSEKNSRLNLSEPLEELNRSGYIFRIDELNENPLKNIEPLLIDSLRLHHAENIVYPRSGELSDDLKRFIEQEISDFEKALYSFDYDSETFGYETWIDVNSFVDYFILNEFSLNGDIGGLSTYMAKDVGGKYQMIIWDMNNSCQNFEGVIPADSFLVPHISWYWMLMKDEAFVNKIIDRYHELRQGVLSEEYLLNYIDETIAYLGNAIDRNYEVWEKSWSTSFLEPVERNPQTYEEAVQQLKQFIIERGRFLDEHIEVLLQYCHESKVKKYNH